jgi:hypothetical protein
MSTMFKAPTSSSGNMAGNTQSQLLLNGFGVTLSSDTFEARTLELPDNKQVKPLRELHKDWFLSWREGILYGIPKTEQPSTDLGEPATLRCSDHLPLLVALIDELMPKKFPTYEAFRLRPFAFKGKRDELIAAIAKTMRNAPALLQHFTIRPTFILEAKIIEPVPDQTDIGLFLTINTKWEINADPAALQTAGVDLSGLYVVRRVTGPGERRLIGQIRDVTGTIIQLGASYDDRTTISTDEVFLEGSKTSFARCLKTLLGRDYDYFEQARQREESKLISGPAVSELLQQFHQFFQKDPTLQLTRDLTVTIKDQLSVRNSASYESIHLAPPVQYYFNPARTKASPYPWYGIKQYGPFSKDTFPKRTPNILVVFPDMAQGATETFLNHLRNGITMPKPAYEGGFRKTLRPAQPDLHDVQGASPQDQRPCTSLPARHRRTTRSNTQRRCCNRRPHRPARRAPRRDKPLPHGKSDADARRHSSARDQNLKADQVALRAAVHPAKLHRRPVREDERDAMDGQPGHDDQR